MNNKTYANYLMHGRTKGSRNGISTTKGYTAVGQKAKGKLINGKYVYDYASTGSQNDWQQQAALERWKQQKRKAFDAAAKENAPRDKARAISKKGASNNWQQQAALEQWKKQNQNAIAAKKTAEAKAQAAKDAAWNAKVQVAKKPTNIGASQAGNTARAMKEYMTKASADRKAKAKQAERNAYLDDITGGYTKAEEIGKKQSWQQIANNYRSANEAAQKAATGQSKNVDLSGHGYPQRVEATNRYINNANKTIIKNMAKEGAAKGDAQQAALARLKTQNQNKANTAANQGKANNWQQNANKTAGILGNMSREDRSLMKSKEWTSIDKDGTKKTNNSFNVNNKYGYSNYTKSDNGWHDIHMGEYNTTGVKGVKKQQDWNTSYERNHRSDVGNAVADAKADAKKAFKEAKADAKQAYVNLKNKFKKKKKK